MNVWRWDRERANPSISLKEQMTVAKLSRNGIMIAGSKTGRISVWTIANGQMVGEIENAHYMEISDLDID